MESWGFDSLDKGYTSNETLSSSDSIFRSKNVLLGWEFKPPFSCDSNLVVPNQHLVENPGFPEVGIAEILRKQFPHDSVRDVFSSNVGDIFRPSIVNFNAISGDEESSSKIATSVVDSNSRESSLIDLKLGGFSDNLKSNSPRAAPILSSAESSTPAKRARALSLTCQTAYCQVYGCNKDLSFAKDYHKRHKVCDVHSKTAKVIVNGIEQRFCQQCSRFHLLAEFDDGKRSCRKRLAGHNERRRKPQVGIGNNRSGRSLHSYPGSIGNKFQGNALAATSFICQDILGTSGSDKYPTNSWTKDIKVEDGASMYGQLEHKSVLTPYLFEKPYTSVINSINGHRQGRIFTENINQYPHEIVSRSLFQTNSLGSEEVTLFDTASAIQGIPGMSESGCALSLLSSQSQNSPCHSPAVPSANPSIIQNSSRHFGLTQVFGSQGLTTERNYPSTMPMLDDGDVDFANGTVQGSGYVNVKESLSCEDGTTIDLLQLSSQLQRVENQRQSGPVKQENERFLLS